MWIFGYGSLIWKVDFKYEDMTKGFIRGHVRRFWQGSEDHRGTPENPGRVVTLITKEQHTDLYKDEHFEDIVWGVAYKIHTDDIDEVRDYLDYREKNGYTLSKVKVETIEGKVLDALVYVASPSNEAFLGPKSNEEIVDHILRSRGPSGPNYEYMLEMTDALRMKFPKEALLHDRHLMSLLNCCTKRLQQNSEEFPWATEVLLKYDQLFKNSLENI
ncbi:hypothetical protein MP638_006357 [Amoeboaphelidium occidentale]|nr:hypothetical protein MP638_006357 [Amoeboaphelidium occidentale]